MLHRCGTLAAAILLTAVAPGNAARLTLVQDGEPAAVIILGKAPNPVAFEAAHELQRVVRRISGAMLPIYLENEFSTGMEGPRRAMPRLFVGDSETAREAGLDLSMLPLEGFVVKTTTFAPTRPSPLTHIRKPRNRHPALILAGRDDPIQNGAWRGERANRYLRGTAYAVYSFLEEELGARWLWPGELGEVVPERSTIRVEPRDRSEAPKLAQRIFRCGRYNSGGWWQLRGQVGTPLAVWTRLGYESGQWMDHLRLGDAAGLDKPSREGVVGWGDKYAETHPEYFALQPTGERLNRELYGRVRLCLSNPEVIAHIVREVCDAFRADPELKIYGIELSDVFGAYCTCASCRDWGPTLSDLVARHWTAIAEQVAREFPDRLLYAHPYHKYVDPPVEVKSLPENIVLHPVGQNISGYTAAPDRERSVKSWLGWSKLSAQIMIWRPNYPCSDVGFPLNYARQLAEDIKLFYANKLAGVDIDHMRNIWAGDGLNYYVACKLFWDPEQDVDALVQDYCDKGFGSAAAAVRTYFDAVEALTLQMAHHEPSAAHPIGLPGGESGGVGLAIHFTPEVTTRFHALLDAAVEAAGEDTAVRARIAFLRTAVTYVELEHRVNLAGRRADAGILTAAEISETRQLLEERRGFLRAAIGSWHLEPEAAWTGADWVERSLNADEDRRDLFADLLLANEEVMTLPEQWRFKTDPAGVSEDEQWFAADRDDSDWGTIRIGEFWERQGYSGYDGIAWYRRKLTLPANLKDRQILFAFGAADENAIVYVDGRHAATSDLGPGGWDKRFVLDLTEHVKPGVEQAYAIRVVDSVGAGGLWKPVKVLTPRDPDTAETVTLQPVKDAWIRRNYPDRPHGDDASLAVGARDFFRSLLAWKLPERVRQATIRGARIVLPLRYVKGNCVFRVYPLSEEWDEATATWNSRAAGEPWSDGGGAVARLPRKPIAEVTLDAFDPDAEGAPPAAAAVLDVGLYLHRNATGLTTFGVILIGPAPDTSFSPHSREAAAPEQGPRLEIDIEL